MVEITRQIDDTDRQLLCALERDGRMTFEELGRAVGLSRPAVHERVKRLVAHGVVRRFGAILDWDAVGLGVSAFLWIRTAAASCAELAQSVARLGSDDVRVEECHRVAGDWSLLVKVRTPSLPSLLAFGDLVRAQPGVVATTTTVVLETISDDARPRSADSE
jgi:Lrp/AsnC family transcriptional regulator, leucine-responsive regulatory protein